MAKRKPTYICQHSSGHIFRYCIPSRYHALIGKKELRYSLRTGSRMIAKRRAAILLGLVYTLLDQLQIDGKRKQPTKHVVSLLNSLSDG